MNHRNTTGTGGARGRGLALLCLTALVGCGGGTLAAGGTALKVSAAVLDGARLVRRHVCAPALDPILGNPREPAPPTSPPSAVPPPPPAVVAPAQTTDGGL